MKHLLCMKAKSEGESNFISGLIVTVMLIVFVFASTSIYSSMANASDIRSACRGILYTMETNGYLTDENKALLTSELEALGCSDISFDGSTLTQASYGELVTLQVTCTISTPVFNMSTLSGGTAGQSVTIIRRTIAKN